MHVAVSYFAIACLAVLPIYAGSHTALRRPASAPKSVDEDDRATAEKLGTKDALVFPLIAGLTLSTLYLVVTYLSEVWLNRFLKLYFCVIGIASNFNMLCELMLYVRPQALRGLKQYNIVLSRNSKGQKDLAFDYNAMYGLLLLTSILLSTALFIRPNWIVSNVFGISFAYNAIQMISLDSFKTGFILLLGLFFYDIYFVFGSKIMVTVAKSIDAPIMLTFPRDILAAPHGPSTMLGLGDIVLPGIFIALNLKYDLFAYHKVNPTQSYVRTHYGFAKPFFNASLLAYCLGMLVTVTILHVFKTAQPALLYLVPACIMSTVLTAFRESDLQSMWCFSDKDETVEKD